ncbi:MAG: OB-fold nucleic acid binding domain-containing protein [archaeon]
MTYQKTRIRPIHEGKYEDHKIIAENARILSQVRVLGTVTDAFFSDDGQYAALTVDDSTAQVRLKTFKEQVGTFKAFKKGDIVDVFGRVREFEGERYLLPDIIKLIEDPNLEVERNAELLEIEHEQAATYKKMLSGSEGDARKLADSLGMSEEEAETALTQNPETEEQKSRVMETILNLDTGDGVEYETIRSKIDIEDIGLKHALGELMDEGEVYEPKYGRYKRL